MIRNYIIISGQSTELLSGKVNERILDGYKPLGGICYNSIFDIYSQAMCLI